MKLTLFFGCFALAAAREDFDDFDDFICSSLDTNSNLPNNENERHSTCRERVTHLDLRGGDTRNDRPKSPHSGGDRNSRPASKRKREARKKSKSVLKDDKNPSDNKSADAMPPPIRKVTASIPGYGKVKGRREGGVDVWRGIPYAAPPVGVLRFSPPEPPQPWAPARLDASRFGPDCWQIHDPMGNPGAEEKDMSEDCLYLNIFTPAGIAARSRQGKFLSGAKKLPVMIWFHGGAFQQGGSRREEYDGRRLAERDIIVVTVNYRLGALGFLVSSEDGLYGNFGLMDQRASIEWIQENIRAFGGDPENVTLFGESAGAVMIGLHLLMDGAGTLFHRVIMQSNPLGYTFRSVVVADFIGQALKRSVDCRDLACLRAERVEEIIAAQKQIIGVPRSVGDFFTWGPTLTKELKLKLSLTADSRLLSKSEDHRLPRLDTANSRQFVSEWRHGTEDVTSHSARWRAVNVSQPFNSLDLIPHKIPIIIGSNKHEGEIFVHTAFPAPMPKAVYWMFVGALFRDSSSRVLKHYRGLVEEVEKEAEELAKKQIEEEEAKHEYLENREQLESEYELLLAMNATRLRNKLRVDTKEGLKALVKTWSTGGAILDDNFINHDSSNKPHIASLHNRGKDFTSIGKSFFKKKDSIQYDTIMEKMSRAQKKIIKESQRAEIRLARQKAKALKEAAKVVVDYRPVMSRIIDDYLFRCPSWRFAQLLSERREQKGSHENNIYVYRFSQPTHIPGYKECWGKSCHTAELPYAFQAMDVIRSNYSTLGPIAQKEAPSTPETPYADIMDAYRGAFEASDKDNTDSDQQDPNTPKKESNAPKKESTVNFGERFTNKNFQQILSHFFGDYFKQDADEELASDMAERWTSFARDGNPNYEGTMAEWLPWRYRPSNTSTAAGHHPDYDSPMHGDDHAEHKNHFPQSWAGNENTDSEESEDFWSSDDTDSEYLDIDEFEGSDEGLSANAQKMYYRQKALDALELEVVDEDIFRTELRRRGDKGNNTDSSLLSGLKKTLGFQKDENPPFEINRNTIKEILLVAQEMGVIGVGGTQRDIIKENFPELLELSWPPEGRLVEKDCTCQMWDKIRYRY